MTDDPTRVLLVDDDPAVGKVLVALLRQDGFEPTHVESAAAAVSMLEAKPFDLVISDIRMPGMDGMKLLGLLRRRWPEIPVVMLTAHGTVKQAVDAMKSGAADFVMKPFDREEILFVARKALAASEAARAATPATPSGEEAELEVSPAMASVVDIVRRVAQSTATVLVRGESGTGKELVARRIHKQSPRSAAPFVAVHCAALPDNLLESELFGYEKGAFTGATSRKPGRVELAEGGTLFLDEIGDVTPALQVKLLRLLQQREYDRLGGTATLTADVRFIAATNRNLEEMVQTAKYREDLFYRLSVVPIWLPPLRERKQEIAPLARLFCREFGVSNGRPDVTLSDDAVSLLEAQIWRGNVRELRNFVERLVVLSDSPVLTEVDVRRELLRQPALRPDTSAPEGPMLDAKVQAAEREALSAALQRAANNRTLAARLLGVSRRTLYKKLHEHRLL